MVEVCIIIVVVAKTKRGKVKMGYVLNVKGKRLEIGFDNSMTFDIEINVEAYVFRLGYVHKNTEGEWFYLHTAEEITFCLISYDESGELALLPIFNAENIEEKEVRKLNEQKEFLEKLYLTIRNHPSCRLKMLHSLGPIKTY